MLFRSIPTIDEEGKANKGGSGHNKTAAGKRNKRGAGRRTVRRPRKRRYRSYEIGI